MTDTSHQEQLGELIAENDTGARDPSGLARKIVLSVALAWPLYQLYMASPLPFLTGIGLIDDSQQRAIHLAFALFLGFMTFPAFLRAPRRHIPIYDWVLAVAAAGCALYILVFYREVVDNAGGLRTPAETIASLLGMALVLELTRRVLGLSLVIVAAVFTVYVFTGPLLPELISHRGFSLNRYVDHMWLTTEGVFGLPLGVSNSFIFLFVLFGALLDKGGAGNFFIKLSFSMLGHLRGGPAKAAVVSSGLTGLISGSAIANVVTTGTFTIPLMKRIGFSGEKAGAIEVSSSINGQIMPPVMGAAAFLMTEFVGITYFEVVVHAFVPAIVSYIGLFYIVHLEAVKANMPVLAKVQESTLLQGLGRFLFGFGSLALVSGLVYAVATGLGLVAGEYATPVAAVLMTVLYVWLLKIAARYPELEIDDPNAPLIEIPKLKPTLMAGLHFALPIGVLIWCLMIQRLSPGLAVSWAIVVMVAIMLTQKPLLAHFRKTASGGELRQGFADLIGGMIAGSRNMVGIAVAMGAAGIIVGVVSLTGLGLLMTEIIDAVAGGNVMLMLLFTALMCIVLGMGLPTTANYIVVASVMAQPLVTLAAQNGLVIPLFAVHLFVFYFGLMSGTTPPVAVDSFAGAAVARSDPMKTCVQAFYYSLRTAILPFIFVMNPEMLLIGVESWWSAALIIVSATIAMCVFAAATQGFFLVKNHKLESALLVIIALSLLRPAFWLDRVQPPFVSADPRAIHQVAEKAGDGAQIQMLMTGENFSGDIVTRKVAIPLGQSGAVGEERLLAAAGLEMRLGADGVFVENVAFNSPAQKWGIDFDWQVLELRQPAVRMAKEWFHIPAYATLMMIVFVQLARRRKQTDAAPI
ncbi:C4-dicarboxylate ABC transporter [Leisingera sp. ANG-M1]|uniref:TRAP transporter permease n=1 Tax=Leisingera sp. ANG-M1 TaxID=1577895 RepID=UPI00057E0A8D|nr:TRAP transporter permease [Leisingera sp. ANG-M1]KIC09277.1 C4-dicarboxylate ABC transporter [Leisingera sp. ANG-M1]